MSAVTDDNLLLSADAGRSRSAYSFVLDVRAPTKTRTDDDTNDNDDSLCLRPKTCIVVYSFRNGTQGCTRQQLKMFLTSWRTRMRKGKEDGSEQDVEVYEGMHDRTVRVGNVKDGSACISLEGLTRFVNFTRLIWSGHHGKDRVG